MVLYKICNCGQRKKLILIKSYQPQILPKFARSPVGPALCFPKVTLDNDATQSQCWLTSAVDDAKRYPLIYTRVHVIFTDYTRLHAIFTDCIRLHVIFTDYTRLHVIFTGCTRLHVIFTVYTRLHVIFTDYTRLSDVSSSDLLLDSLRWSPRERLSKPCIVRRTFVQSLVSSTCTEGCRGCR